MQEPASVSLKSTLFILQKKFRKNQKNRDKGFTLLELLISLTILSLIVVIIFGAFRISIKAWEKGEKNIQTRQRYRIVLNLIQHQLASIYLDNIQNNGRQPFYLKGDTNSLEFLSQISMVPDNKSGIVYVKYQIRSEQDKQSLLFYEKNIVLLSKDINLNDLAEDDYYELIPEIYELKFEYLKDLTPSDDNDEWLVWLPDWDMEIQKDFPAAVRIKFKASENFAPIYVVIPIKKIK